MVTYYVKKNEIYTITSINECKVYNASGVLVATCPANSSINITAATNKLKLSDDYAAIQKATDSPGSGAISEELLEHINNSEIHTSAGEKTFIDNHIADSDIHLSKEEKELIATALQPEDITHLAVDAEVVHKTGDEIVDGVKTFSDQIVSGSDVSLTRNETTGWLQLGGGDTDLSNGAQLQLAGKDNAGNEGHFRLVAKNSENSTQLIGTPSAALTWDGKNIVRSVNTDEAIGSGNVTLTQFTSSLVAKPETFSIVKATDTGTFTLSGGTSETNNSAITLHGGSNTSLPGQIKFSSDDGVGAHTLTFGKTTSTVVTMTHDGDTAPMIYNNVDHCAYTMICGGYDASQGAAMTVYGKGHADTSRNGGVALHACDGTNHAQVVFRATGYVVYTSDSPILAKDDTTGWMRVCGGTNMETGARLQLAGQDHTGYGGEFWLVARSGDDAHGLVGKPDGTLTWSGKSVVTSVNGVDATDGDVVVAPDYASRITIESPITFQAHGYVFVNPQGTGAHFTATIDGMSIHITGDNGGSALMLPVAIGQKLVFTTAGTCPVRFIPMV